MPRKSSEKTRERIIRAAAQVFYNVNYHEAGLRDIAKLSGISPRCIYKYFPNKEQLLVAMNNEGLKLMKMEMEQHLTGVEGALNKLRKMTYFYLDYFKRNPRIAWQVYISTNLSMWRSSDEAWRNLGTTQAVLGKILQEGQACGEFRQDIDSNAVRLLYFGGIRFAIQSWLASEQDWDLMSVAEGLTTTVYEAIKKQADSTLQAACPLLRNQAKNIIEIV
ncbi:MAG: TetR/AcrR family transcriptional regulator [Chloroflexi bacterium]|nr:TetR/AcrR family transcriptional regulator [Chloroflexota bacterium]